MRTMSKAAALLGTLFILTGCGKGINCDLPPEPIKFNTKTYVSPTDKDDTYLEIEYDGRKFLPYGTVERSLKGEDVGKCLGYVVQDCTEDKNTRICLLTATEDYLAEIFIDAGMQQPVFFRAEDTIGKTADTPSYIKSLDYDIWR